MSIGGTYFDQAPALFIDHSGSQLRSDSDIDDCATRGNWAGISAIGSTNFIAESQLALTGLADTPVA